MEEAYLDVDCLNRIQDKVENDNRRRIHKRPKLKEEGKQQRFSFFLFLETTTKFISLNEKCAFLYVFQR